LERFSEEKKCSFFSERGRETAFSIGSVTASIAGTIPNPAKRDEGKSAKGGREYGRKIMDSAKVFKGGMDIIKGADTAYLATIDEKGKPSVRAMLNLRCEAQFPGLAEFFKKNVKSSGFDMFFTTNTSSRKMKQLKVNNACSIYYNVGYNGLELNGKCETVNDLALKESLWQDGWELYYPRGRKDPDYSVLKFTPKTVRLFGNLSVSEVEL